MSAPVCEVDFLVRDINLRRVELNSEQLHFRQEAAIFCSQKTGMKIDESALEKLHKIIPFKYQQVNAENINQLTHMISMETCPSIYTLYLSLVKKISGEIFREDLVFENSPYLRFHFPQRAPDHYRLDNGELACYHCDIMLGDHPEQYNCWLSITDCIGSSGLQMASLTDSHAVQNKFVQDNNLTFETYKQSRRKFFDWMNSCNENHLLVKQYCYPLITHQNELVIFDPSIIHGTAENTEDLTRISIDFRVIRVSEYENIINNIQNKKQALTDFDGMHNTKGGYYHLQTINELSSI